MQPTPPTNTATELTGIDWQLVSLNGQPALAETPITARFGDDGKLTGSAGCNRYIAGYHLDGQNIAIGPVAATRMACPQPEGVMQQEAQYLTALSTAATYAINLKRLELRTAAGALVASFDLATPVAMATAAPAEEIVPTTIITGAVTYLQRIALPAEAVVKVQLQDTSRADAPAIVVGQQLIPTHGQQVPIPFAVSYNPAEIQDHHTYTLSARIEDGTGKLLFINTSLIPVITRGNPATGIEVVVQPT